MEEIILSLREAFKQWAGESCSTVKQLPASGSERIYWRLAGSTKTAIGVYHPVKEENMAFMALTSHFRRHGLNVPEVYFSRRENNTYLLRDLGDVTLFSLLGMETDNPNHEQVISLFGQALDELIRFQVIAGKDLDYRNCYPRQSFDRQSLEWDLNYFKYDFLKLLTGYHEQRLEEDFSHLADFLLEAPGEHFMYRDFQSRNIMIHEGSLYFIDYQGGRKGPLQYDPVSLLFQVRADLSSDIREKLLDEYLSKLKEAAGVGREAFLKYHEGFILLRLLQVLGAYGFRGIIQKKSHFLTSIPYAISHLQWFLKNNQLPVRLPELFDALNRLTEMECFQTVKTSPAKGLTVSVISFSYNYGIPEDFTGHGGGFVFDCRALPNPGREESMRAFNGKDALISEYLKASSEVEEFLGNVYGIVGQAVENYLQRGFGHLSVSFGCTGGQHRSVYCAEQLATLLKNKFHGINVSLVHRELINKK